MRSVAKELYMCSRRRFHIPEAQYYITVVTDRRVGIFSDPANARLMLQVVDEQRRRYDFYFYEFVLMPDHYHFIITPPCGRKIGDTIRHINGVFGLQYNRIHVRSGRVFQPDYYDHVVRNEKDYRRIAEYIHNNPVRDGIVERPEAYLWSSARYRLLGDDSVIRVDDLP